MIRVESLYCSLSELVQPSPFLLQYWMPHTHQIIYRVVKLHDLTVILTNATGSNPNITTKFNKSQPWQLFSRFFKFSFKYQLTLYYLSLYPKMKSFIWVPRVTGVTNRSILAPRSDYLAHYATHLSSR